MDSPLRIAICEDRAEDAALLSGLIGQSGIAAVCERYCSGEALLASFAAARYDLIFMDIYMGGMRGVEAAAEIRRLDENVTLAFTTTSPDHTLESYRLGALKYLEKPVTEKEVRRTLQLALQARSFSDCITLPSEGRLREIPLDGILYLEQRNHAVTVNMTSGVIRVSQSVRLTHIEGMLPVPPFLRCHHSYIVNLRHVRSMDKELKVFTMQNGGKAYIRRQDIKAAVEAYESFLFSAAREGGAL